MRSSAAAWRLRAVPKFMELNDCWVWKKKLFGSILFSRLLASLCGKIVLQPQKSTKFTKARNQQLITRNIFFGFSFLRLFEPLRGKIVL